VSVEAPELAKPVIPVSAMMAEAVQFHKPEAAKRAIASSPKDSAKFLNPNSYLQRM
tara:strand:- start:78 stop:245 length:168 start_codon:yes stop_codon:yes gene_type:complete